jgi:hypothetical protein
MGTGGIGRSSFGCVGLLEMGQITVAFGTFSPASMKCSIWRMRNVWKIRHRDEFTRPAIIGEAVQGFRGRNDQIDVLKFLTDFPSS